jgi:hypothetical protein
MLNFVQKYWKVLKCGAATGACPTLSNLDNWSLQLQLSNWSRSVGQAYKKFGSISQGEKCTTEMHYEKRE